MPWDEVMHKFKHGELHSGSKSGPKVKNRKQAIAIMMDEKREYLGDGVYATFDDYQIWLSTERDGGVQHTIALEPEVFAALQEYARRLREERA